MSELSPIDKLVRKLRKKLREIERLEISDRSSLNREEISKIKRKQTIREELSQLLDEKQGDESVENTDSSSNSPQKCLKEYESQNNEGYEAKSGENNSHCTSSLRQRKGKPIEIAGKIQDLELNPAIDPVREMKRSNPEELSPDTPEQTVREKENKRLKPECSLANGTTQIQTNAKDTNSSSKVNEQTEIKRSKPASSPKQTIKGASLAKVPEENKWHEQPFVFNYLDGHSDLISCVDLDDDYLVSGSRDTQVQVWCAKTGAPLVNLRGHTNAITCVSLLTCQQSKELHSQLIENENEQPTSRLVLSTSADCCIKLWNIEDGTALRSIYTFSGITALCYLPKLKSCVIGSEGGKLEVYSLSTEHVHPVATQRAFEGPVSSIKVQCENLVCSSFDGYLSVYVLRESGLCRLYNSDDLISENGQLIDHRPILTLAITPSAKLDSPLYFGDEGSSIKILTWKTGRIKKLRNHAHEFGQTNSVFATQSFLLSSSINIDTGDSSVNVFSLPELKYLGSLSVAGLGRIVCLAAIEDDSSNGLRIAAGGSKLIVIETKGVGCKRSAKKDLALKGKFVKNMTLPASDTDDESSASSEEDVEDVEESDERNLSLNDSKNSWCLIL